MKSNTLFGGLDVHRATVVAAVAEGKRDGEIRQIGTIPHRADQIRKLVEKLDRGSKELRFCYEARRKTKGSLSAPLASHCPCGDAEIVPRGVV
ncbi:MAG: hypothetical protein ACP5QR_16960 [Rhizomicrobium sp.]